MGKRRKHKKPKSHKPQNEAQEQEQFIYGLAKDLSQDTGISYSEALGYVLGIKNPTYGWENDLTDEEFQALLNQDE